MPAFSFAPISAANVFAPASMASQIDARPTPKHAQTTGLALTTPSLDRPDNSRRRSSSVSVLRREQAFHHVPIAGVMCGAYEQAGLDAIPDERSCAKNATAKVPVLGDIAIRGSAQP